MTYLLKRRIVVLLLAVAATCITFYPFIFSPWDALPQQGGDSVKNVYVFLYHSIYGGGTWFHGMNYPYGEHIIYNDAFPIFSVFLTPFYHITIGQGFAIIWWTIALSYILGIIYLYRILRTFSVPAAWAILFACLIGICSPQIPRINGHYSLSLCCIIPMVFYWTLKYLHTSRPLYSFYIFLLGCVVYFIHPYFNGLLIMWGLFFCTGYLVFYNRSIRSKIRFVAIYLAGMLGTSAFILIYVQLTDPLKDRPKIPWGAMEYHTRLNDIFTSYVSPVWQLLQKAGLKIGLAPFDEGYSYIGITTTIIVIMAIVFFCLAWIRGKISGKPVPEAGGDTKPFYRLWIFMAIGLLLVGMGIPFIFNMEWLLHYLPGFRQFRALGRFSWMWYYLITVLSVVALYHYSDALKEKGKTKLSFAVMFMALLTWSWEATGSIGFVRQLGQNAKNNYDWFVSAGQPGWKDFLKQKNYSDTSFQAIIPMKYVNQGTEKFYIDPSENRLISQVFRASFQLHLPTTANYAGRASLSAAEKQIKISDGPFTYKPMLADCKNDKPFLMLVCSTDQLNPDEQYLLEASDYLGDFSDCHIYAFYPSRCMHNDAQWADSIKKILPFVKADSCMGDNNVIIEHFDAANAPAHFFGRGALSAVPKDDTDLWTFKIKPLKDSTLFEFSAWFLVSMDDYRSPDVYLKMLDSNNNEIGFAGAATKFSSDAEGLWFRNSVYFMIPPACRGIKCRVLNYGRSSYIAVDELQLRPASTIIISKSNDRKVLVNNHLLR